MNSTPAPHLRRLLALLLALALIRGLIYATVVPLWHAADEANHIEYVLFILRENRLPLPEAVAGDLRREILASMWEKDGITAISHLTPGDLLRDAPPRIPGPSEFSHPPAYYLLMATLLRPLAHHDVTTLAYAARLWSVLLGIISVGSAALAAQILFKGRTWAVGAALLLILFIPAHTFSTSTINNDQLAEVAMSLFFYLWILVFHTGLSWRKATGLVAVILIGLLAKRTTVISLPLSLSAVIILVSHRLSKARTRLWRGILLTLTAGTICLAVALLGPEGIAGWYTSTGSVSQTGQISKNGEHAMRVTPDDKGFARVYQAVPPQALEKLQGQMVSFGAWMRGEPGSRIQLQISTGGHQHRKDVAISNEWQFQHVVGQIEQNAPELRLILTVRSPHSTDVYIDDLSLLAKVGNESFVYNGSAERRTWALRPWGKSLFAKLRWLRLDPSVVQSVLDVRETWRFRDILIGIVDNLFKLFWAAFGVREVYVGQVWFYLLTMVHLLAGAGLVRAWKRRHSLQPPASREQVESLVFALLAVTTAVVAALARGYPPGTMDFVPAGRYLYVVTVPYALLMVTGIGSWIPQRYHSLATTAATAMLISFDALCLFYYIIPHWYG